MCFSWDVTKLDERRRDSFQRGREMRGGRRLKRHGGTFTRKRSTEVSDSGSRTQANPQFPGTPEAVPGVGSNDLGSVWWSMNYRVVVKCPILPLLVNRLSDAIRLHHKMKRPNAVRPAPNT